MIMSRASKADSNSTRVYRGSKPPGEAESGEGREGRVGEIACKACGSCCKELAFFIAGDAIVREFWKARGVKGDYFRIPHRCPQLGEDDKCTVYDSRPLACKTFPYRVVGMRIDQGVLPEGCAYKQEVK